MQGRRLVESLIGVAGIWLLARQIPDFVTIVIMVSTGRLSEPGNGPSLLTVQSIQFAASILVGMTLLLMRGRLGRWLHPAEDQVALQAQPIFAAGLAIVAVNFVLEGLVTLSQYFGWREEGLDQPRILWSGSASILLGALLFALSTRSARLWKVLFGGAQRVA